MPVPTQSVGTRSTKRPGRRGTVLLYSALVLFVFLAVAALVVDLGLSFLARRQVQSVVDAVALDTARGEDVTDLEALLLANVPLQKTVTYSGGIPLEGTAFDAGQFLQVENTAQVPGALPTFSTAPPGGNYLFGPNVRHVEQADGSRDDVAAGGAAPDATVVQASQLSPYLFTRGVVFQAPHKATGITVRATAIATSKVYPVDATGRSTGPPMEVGRAKTVGRPVVLTTSGRAASLLPGVTPFVLTPDGWRSLTAGQAVSATVSTTADASGYFHLMSGMTDLGVYGVTAPVVGGTAVAIPAREDLAQYKTPLMGQSPTFYVPIAQAVTQRQADGSNKTVYVAVGFGVVTIAIDSVSGSTPLTFSFTKQNGTAALPLKNASASWSPPANSPLDVTTLLSANAAFDTPLYAPVLVRSTGPLR